MKTKSFNVSFEFEVYGITPDYCGKSENYARQVLLENHRARCDSLGGTFEGDVYPKTLPNGETEHCVSGSCDACDSKWRNDLVNDWKEEVCCGERGKEPNANNGSCTNPASPTPDKIGVGHSRITAFPGCSETPAGEGVSSSSSGGSRNGNKPMLGKFADFLYYHFITSCGMQYVLFYEAGEAYASPPDYDKAMEFYEKAVEKYNDHKAYLGLGLIYMAKKDYDNVIEYYKKAVELVKDAKIYYAIGEAYKAKEDKDKELEYKKKAEELGYKNDE